MTTRKNSVRVSPQTELELLRKELELVKAQLSERRMTAKERKERAMAAWNSDPKAVITGMLDTLPRWVGDQLAKAVAGSKKVYTVAVPSATEYALVFDKFDLKSTGAIVVNVSYSEKRFTEKNESRKATNMELAEAAGIDHAKLVFRYGYTMVYECRHAKHGNMIAMLHESVIIFIRDIRK